MTFVRNTVTNKLTIISPSNIDNNIICSIELKSGSKYSNITNNVIGSTITVDDVNVTIKFNNISTTNKYAVVVNEKGAVITNNILYAETKFGNDAVYKFQDTTVVQNNNSQPSYKLLQWIINGATGNMTLGQDYYFNESYDSDAFDGVIINKDLKIIGNGYTIDGMEKARIFQITNGANVVMENVTFINGKAQSEEFKGNNHDVGGAISVKLHSNLTLINCKFTNIHADQNGWGGAIFITGNSTLSIIASDFTDAYAHEAGNVLYALDGNYVDILECNVDGINLVDIDLDDMGDCIGNDKGDRGLLAPIKIFKTPNLIANISNYVEGENAQIKITEPSNFSGRANLNICNKTVFNIQFNDGVASVQLDVTPGKVYAATITNDYAEYDKDISLNIAKVYVPTTTATNSFKVMKKPNIQFDVKNITYNQIQTIKATMNGTGNVTIKLNGATIVDNRFINKTVICTIGDLNVGIYSIELNYSGDEFTIPGVAVFNFAVNKINSVLSASSVVTVYNGGKYLAVTLKDAVNKPIGGVEVKINLNGIIYTKITDKNGNVKLSTDGLAPKTYLATISFAGNAQYVKSTKTANVKVTKATPKLVASKKSFKKSTKIKKFVVTLKTNRNKVMKNTKVILKVNKKTYKVKTNNRGKATFKITNLKKKGKYSAMVVYSGDKCYNRVSVNVKITVK